MAINKVKYGNTTLIDLTGTTATADKILTGYGAYGKDGVWMDGSASTGSGAVADEITQLQGGGDWHNVYGVDLTQDTVAANKMLSGTTAHNSAGEAITGTIATMTLPTSTSTSTNSGTNKATISRSTSTRYINIPEGYNSSKAYYTISAIADGTAGTPTASKGTVSNHSISVTPSVTNTTGYITGGTKTGTAVTVSASELVSGTLTIDSSGTKDVTNYASASVAAGSATTPATTITANPSISVNSSGLITATTSKTQSITPTVSAGYVSSGAAGTITVSGSNTSQLTTKSAAIITPTTTDQTIASGTYLTGTQTIAGDANLVASNIKKDATIFGVTGTYGGNSASYGTFTVYSDNSTTRSYIRYSTMLVRNNIYYPALVPLKASTETDPQKLGRALVNSTDGLLYVLFYSNAGGDTYTPSVTADSGTCTLVYLGNAGGTFDNHTIWSTGTQGPYALYKVSVGAVLKVTHYNNS